MTVDLFETPEMIPTAVAALFEEWNDEYENGDAYQACRKLLSAVIPLGYKFDYGLDGVPYNLEEVRG